MLAPETLRVFITEEFADATDRLAAVTLAQAAQDLALGDESERCHEAREWFRHGDTGEYTLGMVCQALEVPIRKVQALAMELEREVRLWHECRGRVRGLWAQYEEDSLSESKETV
jgi:hypothetical protein